MDFECSSPKQALGRRSKAEMPKIDSNDHSIMAGGGDIQMMSQFSSIVSNLESSSKALCFVELSKNDQMIHAGKLFD